MRTHLCGQIVESDIDQTIVLSGWVLTRRDHGGVIFIDLRDRSGKVQVVADPDYPEPFSVAEDVRNEYVLEVAGRVRRRPEGTDNPELPTGTVEVLADSLRVLSPSKALPFQVEDVDISETVRLKYRYLDLRRAAMQCNLRLRHRVVSELRCFLNEREFVEIETPMLTRSTPEGARDYLVPSRTHPGEFFALPQSPQLFKQLLMVAGFERYYQVARCFRDEDLRSDRQPEFTQLDVEISFMDEAGITGLMEEMIRTLFHHVLDVQLPNPIPRITYQEALLRYGVDRPDLRIDMELKEITDLMKSVDFKVFSQVADDPKGRVAVMKVPGGNSLSRAQIDGYTDFVKQYGAKGLAYIKVNDVHRGREGLQSPILKFLPDAVLSAIVQRSNTETGDLLFFGADNARIVNDSLGALRLRVGRDLGMVQPGWKPLWVVDFPLVEWNSELKCWNALHHPFTAPRESDEPLLDSAPGRVLSRAYDMVLNGTEIGGGSIRIHRAELQRKVFGVLGISEQEAREKFGFLMDGLDFGAPPHGGIAFGLDRLVAMMGGVESIRDVIAFPKTQKASCLLTAAPSEVDTSQLQDLALQVRKSRVAQVE